MLIVKSDLDIVKNRHILKQTDILESSCNTCPVDLNRIFSRNILSIQFNNTLCRFVYTCEKVENCCFAGTVRSNQAIELTFFDGYVKSINCTKTAELDSQMIYLQHCHS